ncbi:MAG: DUF4340 domain-containing protein [Deltaproteobacteria bacterium]|nr:DUF4340 domain-containing protein [Deltaproteobacteria bacterium]
MKRTILFLSLALVLQLALALTLQLADKSGKSGTSQGKLLAIKVDQIDTVRIEGSGGDSVLLRKTGGKWTLPEHFDAPGDSQKIEGMVTTLTGIQRSWPVAETGEAVKRFKVGDEGFERRLSFKAGDKELAVLYLGTSPGFRKVHARVGKEEQVFDIPFSTFQASLKNADWVNKQLLWIDSETITAIELPDCRLIRTDGEWTLADIAENEETEQEKARQVAQQLARINFQDIYAKDADPLSDPVELKIRLELKDGPSRNYEFFKKDDQPHALLKVSGEPFLFKVGTTVMEELQETTRSKLIKPRETTTQPSLEPEKAEG